ncbi:MAG: thioredoxin family protein [Desulfurococcaceae archaeon]
MAKSRKDSNRALYLLLPIIAAIVVIALLAITQQPVRGNVTFYTGVKEIGRIDISEDEWKLIYDMLVNRYNVTQDTRIVMFGATWCPHCHKQYLFFENNSYLERSLVLWLDQDDYATLLFNRISQLEVRKGFTRYAGAVPHILVINKGVLEAIIVGEALDKSFWDKLLG